ncbi:MAG: M12 family metallo-peptidase [Burkholderiales bacterium]
MATGSPRTFYSFARIVAACLLLVCAPAGAAPPNAPDLMAASGGLWRDVAEGDFQVAGERLTVPQRYRVVALNPQALQQQFFPAAMEGTEAARANPVVVSLPMPDGDVGRFEIVETAVMAPELAAKFPEIRTWAGQGIDDPAATVRLDWTPLGFHAMVLSAERGRVFIDPYSRNDTAHYISYYTRDLVAPPGRGGFFELPPEDPGGLRSAEIRQLMAMSPAAVSGTELRTYRLAVAATGEYTAFFGGTVALGQAAIVTAVNRVTGIYETEVAVRLQLVANNNLLVYTDPNTDPYTNNSGSTMLGQNQTNIDAVIGTANYDIGHVFSTGGGGIASLGVPCRAGLKARGVTGLSAPTGDAFYVDYVAHEMGHQFGGNHTFNSVASNCGGGNRNASTAYEPGSGSTIMAYAGICGADDLQPHSDPYFHTVSFDEIVAYTKGPNGNSCPVTTATGNSVPVPSVGGSGFTIPAQTPFALTGSATDANGDPLTYNWEEFDLDTGGGGPPNRANVPPFFRSWNATASPTRTFPRLSDLLANTTVIGEVLPNVSRALNFRLTVRDNRSGGGGVAYATLAFNVTTAAGPFTVTSPNTAVTWPGGSTQTVTWNVANTTAAPVSCANVNILLSTDGGQTFPTTLAAATPNDGSQNVTIPATNSTTARVKVACSNNIFFDISDTNFTIGAAPPGPTVTTNPATAITATGATLNGTVSSNGASTTVTFQYGTTTGYGSTATAAQSPLGSGASGAAVSAAIGGLACNTLFHFRAVGANVNGTTNGADATFTTAACGGPTNTTTALSGTNNPAVAGTLVTFTATVTGNAPTGTVAFTDNGTTIGGCSAVALTGGGNVRTATCSTSSLALGSHNILASYSGDASNNPSVSANYLQTIIPGGPGIATIITNPYGTISVTGATLNGNVISNFQSNVVIQFGTVPGAQGSFSRIEFQGFNTDPGKSITIRSGATGQTLVLVDTSGAASNVFGTFAAQGGNGAPPPLVYLRNGNGFAIGGSGFVQAPSGLTVDALGSTAFTGKNIENLGVVDGGSGLQLLGANIKGGGQYKGDATTIATFGNANNPVNGNQYLANGLQLYGSTDNKVALTVNAYGPAPQVLNLTINGRGTVWMPSSWPAGFTSPPNNSPLAPGAVRPPGTPEPAYGGGSMIVQGTVSLALVNGGTNDFVFPGAIVLKAGNDLDLNGVLVNQGWTTTGKQFQGIFLEAPNIVSPAGNMQFYTNYPNWVNFSTLPHAPVRAFTLMANSDGSASFVPADATVPHLNTYSTILGIAVSGGCWVCAFDLQPIDVFGP